ncbi:hypothetical protein NDU88_003732 [Pleurodeles waltl]|uniref:Uncharacterized protein n=1 Tax=Pleurodeles waltl TaxID=8319 RepID=A0AAV7T659_PLEWA|nr:hypothetical protein NDU88_003732 [Pleurodeles waltl]
MFAEEGGVLLQYPIGEHSGEESGSRGEKRLKIAEQRYDFTEFKTPPVERYKREDDRASEVECYVRKKRCKRE